MESIFHYRSHQITPAQVEYIRQLMAAHPEATRRRLSFLLCEAWGWRQANGAPRDMVCRGLLLSLHRAGRIELPAARLRSFNPAARYWNLRGKAETLAVDTTPVAALLSALRPLEFRPVRRTPEEALFNHLIAEYHPLGYTQPVGEHLKYIVYSAGCLLACLAWSSAPRHLGARDRYIGWSGEARRHNIRFLAYNPRYLIVPWVRVKYLASHILGEMARRISADWEQAYGHPVYFLETFVDPERHHGACYRAANWVVMGRTTGRGKNDQTHRPSRSIKDVLGYPLVKSFRARLAEAG